MLRYLLERQAAERPDAPFIRTVDGGRISYADFTRSVRTAAAALERLGVKQGDTVTVWLPNSVDMVRVWFAINWLGAGLGVLAAAVLGVYALARLGRMTNLGGVLGRVSAASQHWMEKTGVWRD